MEDLGRKDILPENYIVYSVDDTEMRALLWSAASEEDVHISESRTTLDVGLPDETTETFRIVRYSMMEPALQEKYPDIRTFYGVST
ncbi:hypothetical protein RZS08_53080, partial [Arthrospira platensis SPKY1]|nr:hypothetical protein [Arthrospira platensis SPKY1]